VRKTYNSLNSQEEGKGPDKEGGARGRRGMENCKARAFLEGSGGMGGRSTKCNQRSSLEEVEEGKNSKGGRGKLLFKKSRREVKPKPSMVKPPH